ncbi:MAG: malonyl-CoA synthase [Gemmobacter sp.]
MTDNLFLALRDAAPADAPLFRLADGTDISYGAAFETAGRIAAVLRGLGLQPGDRVAAQVDKSWQAVALYLGTLQAGGVFLPLNTAYTAAEIGYFLGDAAPRVFVCAPARADEAGGVAHVLTLDGAGGGSLMEAAAGAAPSAGVTPREGGDLAAILYTSGTTGRSKGAMLSHLNLLSNALVLKDYWGFTATDRLIHALPIFHTHGLFVATNTLMLAGGAMIFLPRFDTAEVLGLMPQATAMMGVPTFYTRLLAHPGLDRAATAHMRLFISGSAPLLAETHRAFEARTGQRILERYGMTETNMLTSNPLEGERIAGTVGFPLPGVSLRIADPETGAELPQGGIGGIEVKGPNVFGGYWQMPEKTATEFRADGFFITGDLGMIDERGYVHIVGRAKDLIISGGYNVYPKEIESEIDDLAGVVESAVIGLPHPDFGEGVAAVVVREPGAALDEAGLLRALTGRLAGYKLPKRVIFLDELPRNAMGKVQKKALRDDYAGMFG